MACLRSDEWVGVHCMKGQKEDRSQTGKHNIMLQTLWWEGAWLVPENERNYFILLYDILFNLRI